MAAANHAAKRMTTNTAVPSAPIGGGKVRTKEPGVKRVQVAPGPPSAAVPAGNEMAVADASEGADYFETQPARPVARPPLLSSLPRGFTQTIIPPGTGSGKLKETKRTSKSLKPRFIIDPQTSPWTRKWDLIMLISLLFTAIVPPVEV